MCKDCDISQKVTLGYDVGRYVGRGVVLDILSPYLKHLAGCNFDDTRICNCGLTTFLEIIKEDMMALTK